MRKLATAALGFSAAIFLASYILPAGWLIAAALLAALIGAALLLARRKWLRPAAVALLFFALGLLEYRGCCYLTTERAREYAGQTAVVQGTVLDYPDDYDSYCRLRVRVTSEDLPHFRAIVYDNRKALLDARPGDTVSFTAKISTADTLYGAPYDNYNVNRYYFRLSIRGDETLRRGGFSFGTLPVRLHHFLCGQVDTVFPEDSRAFVKALMLGDKQDFYDNDALYVTMSRSGLMHVVAVSGLHISFLVGLLGLVLGNGRRGAVFSIALIWGFVLVTGGSSSARRAAFMQTLLLMAPIVRRENDPITSLSAALAAILAACPFAARSASLQLSFAAMAGILCFGERLYAWLLRPIPEHRQGRVTRYTLGVMASSLSVMPFTLPLTAIWFSYVPLLAVVSNVACLWAVSLCFCLAWAACLLSFIPALGAAVGTVCAWGVRYILFITRLVARSPYAVLYLTADRALGFLLAGCVLLALGFLLRRRRVLRVLLPTGLALLLLVGTIVHTERRYREDDYVTVLNVGQGQCITAFAGDVTAVIDCGNINTLDNAGAVAGEYLLACGRRNVDMLILTHMHSDHVDGAARLMEMLPVDTLILPAEEEESELLNEILACAARHGTKVEFVADRAAAACGRMAARLYRFRGGDENERCLMIDLAVGDRRLLVTADAPMEQERALCAAADLENTDILIVGHHGSKYASSEELLREVGGGLAVISAGYNTFGHPAPETLERLAANGYEVLRTDVNGTVEIHLEREHG